MMPSATPCPGCGSPAVTVFYEVAAAPIHSVRLISSRPEALNYPTGPISLGFCRACGLMLNTQFSATGQEYDSGYESTQSFSATFSGFARRLAAGLVERYRLYGKTILEIGCGNGEFLAALCETGGSRGIGFDPAYLPGRVQSRAELTFVKDFDSRAYAQYQADFWVCKMTLEHIGAAAEFVQHVAAGVKNSPGAVVYFQVPDMTRILDELAFWDVYYEHAAYFTPHALTNLFRLAGFGVLDVYADYGGQYLMLEARLEAEKSLRLPEPAAPPQDLTEKMESFAQKVPRVLEKWRAFLAGLPAQGQKAVLWGAGSKAVAFLTTLGGAPEIEFCVDINPHKTGTFMAGTGQKIVAPDFLARYRPEVVIVMNPIYLDEIEASLTELGLHPRLMPVTELQP